MAAPDHTCKDPGWQTTYQNSLNVIASKYNILNVKSITRKFEGLVVLKSS